MMEPDSGINVVLVDDHPAVREGLALLLAAEGIHVCAEASGVAEGLACARKHNPDVAIVDLSLDGEEGLALVELLHQRDMPVLVYSMHNDARRISRVFAAGALGYVTKRESHSVLVEAIREVAARRCFVSRQAGEALVENLSHEAPFEGVRALSHQEREVYLRLGRGEGAPEIAAALGVSTHTVESYFARILVKLHLSGMYELRRHAIAYGRSETGD